jgi:hypothetical protein
MGFWLMGWSMTALAALWAFIAACKPRGGATPLRPGSLRWRIVEASHSTHNSRFAHIVFTAFALLMVCAGVAEVLSEGASWPIASVACALFAVGLVVDFILSVVRGEPERRRD